MAAQRQKRLENQMLCYDGVVRKKVEHRREDQKMVIIEKPRLLPPVLSDAESKSNTAFFSLTSPNMYYAFFY